MAIAASAPGIQAPDSCPKSPRIPQPIESEIAMSSIDSGRRNGLGGVPGMVGEMTQAGFV